MDGWVEGEGNGYKGDDGVGLLAGGDWRVVGRVIVQEGFAHRVHVKPGNLEATAGLPLSLSVLSREGLAGVRFK